MAHEQQRSRLIIIYKYTSESISIGLNCLQLLEASINHLWCRQTLNMCSFLAPSTFHYPFMRLRLSVEDQVLSAAPLHSFVPPSHSLLSFYLTITLSLLIWSSLFLSFHCFGFFFPLLSLHLHKLLDVWLEENSTKSSDSTPEKTIVKERILEKIDLSKGISWRLRQLVV